MMRRFRELRKALAVVVFEINFADRRALIKLATDVHPRRVIRRNEMHALPPLHLRKQVVAPVNVVAGHGSSRPDPRDAARIDLR